MTIRTLPAMGLEARQEIIDEYNFMLDQSNKNGWAERRPCHGNEATFSDYKTSPSPEKAKEMCAPCPMLELCDARAQVDPPSWTVLGGVAYVDKRPFQPTSQLLATIPAA